MLLLTLVLYICNDEVILDFCNDVGCNSDLKSELQDWIGDSMRQEEGLSEVSSSKLTLYRDH